MTLVIRSPRQRRHPRLQRAALAVGTVLVGALLALAPVGAVTPASAAEAIEQCDDSFNDDAAELQCTVTVENFLDRATGVESSVVTILRCIGAPASVTCDLPVVQDFQTLTTSVEQCNGSANAGGSVIRCEVVVTNVVTNGSLDDQASVTAATVNQCAGSGEGGGVEPTLNCDSYDTTTSATITQCNGSVNGGGPTLRVNCTVGPSTQTALVPVVVNQCNGSANNDGALAFCTVRLVNDVRLAVVPPVTDGGGTGAGTPVAQGPGGAGGALRLADTGADALLPAALGLLALTLGGTLSLVALARRRRTMDRG